MRKWPSILFGSIAIMTSTLATAVPWQDMELVGKGKLSVLFWDIYNAELFTDSGQYEESKTPIALKLTYLRDIDKKDLINETVKQWGKVGFKDKAKIESWSARLEELWTDVAENDSITLYIDQENCSYFFFNEEELGKVDDPQFSSAFLAIWLSEKTTAPKVRKQLIKGSKRNA